MQFPLELGGLTGLYRDFFVGQYEKEHGKDLRCQ